MATKYLAPRMLDTPDRDRSFAWLLVVGAVLVALFLGGLTTALCHNQATAWNSPEGPLE